MSIPTISTKPHLSWVQITGTGIAVAVLSVLGYYLYGPGSGLYIVIMWLTGALSGWLANRKNRNPLGYIILGVGCGLLGVLITVIILALTKRNQRPTNWPAGWYPSSTPGVLQWWTGKEWSNYTQASI